MFFTILPKILYQNDKINLQTFGRFLSSDPEDQKYTVEMKLNMKTLPQFSDKQMVIEDLEE